MKVLKIFLYAILGILALYLLACIVLPDRFEVSRSIEIDADPTIVFNQVNNFTNWDNWEVWSEMDSTMSYSFGDRTYGVGASRSWTSEKVGNGTMRITNSELLKQIDFDISIDDWNTFEGHFIFEPTEMGVKVTWTDEGDLDFLVRGMGPIFDVMMGKDFEKGLSNLKAHCEGLPARTGAVELISWPAQTYVYILDSCSVNDISTKLGELYGEVYQTIAMQGVMPTSQPFARYERFPLQAGDKDIVVLKAGTFVEAVIETEGRVQLGTSQEGNTLQASHFGVYETVGKTHGALHEYAAEKGYVIQGSAYEMYLTDPAMESNPANWETNVIYEITNK